jgi:hypothetical protein
MNENAQKIIIGDNIMHICNACHGSVLQGENARKINLILII